MIITYDTTGKLINAVWQRDRLVLDNNNFIEIDEIPENKDLIIDIQLSLVKWSANTYTVSTGQLLKNGLPFTIIEDTDRSQLKSTYQNMITRLDQIQAASNPTNAQIVQAIKDEALYIERIMKVIKTVVT